MTVGIHRALFSLPGSADVSLDMSCDVDDVTTHHGRDDPTAQAEASTSTLSIPGVVPDGVDIGSKVVIDTKLPDATWSRRFAGAVTDVVATWDVGVDTNGGVGVVPRTTVTAAGPLSDLGRRVVGDTPWAQELDGARIARILDLAAGTIGAWTYKGTSPDGWNDNYFGSQQAILSAAPDGLRIEWVPGSAIAAGFAWRSSFSVIAGRRYTCSIEVLVPIGQPAVRLSNPFVADGPWIQPSNEWQTISLTFTAPDSAPRAMGPQAFDPARPAGMYCLCRSWRLYEADANPLALGVIDPGTVQILARDVDRQPALDLAQSTAVDGAGILWETRTGLVSYADADHRKSTPIGVLLDACDVLMAPVWSRTLGGLVNDVSLGYGTAPGGGEQPRFAVTRPDSLVKYGRYAYSTATQLAALADATRRANILVARGGVPVWNVTTLPLDLSLLDDAQTTALLTLDVNDLVGLLDLPVGTPGDTATSLWIEGWTEHLAYGVHELALSVSAYCRTSPPPEWDEAPATATWDSIGGRVLAATNLVTNPSMEAASGTVVVRTNLFPNPAVANNTVSWGNYTGVGGAVTAAQVTGSSGYSFGVTTSYRVTWTTATTSVSGGINVGNAGSNIIPVTPGRTYSAMVQAKASKVQRLAASIIFYDNAGAQVGILTGAHVVPAGPNTVVNLSVDAAVAPATAVRAVVYVASAPGASATFWNPADWIDASNAHIEETDQHLQPGGGPTVEYNAIHGTFNGASPATQYGNDYTYAWAGAAHASASEQRAPVPVGWTTPVAGVVHRSSDRAYVGTYSARYVAGTGTWDQEYFQFIVNTVVGKVYTCSAYVWLPTSGPAWKIRVGGVGDGTNTNVRGQWVRLTVTWTATAVTSRVLIAPADASGPTTRGDDLVYADAWMVEEGANPSDYFDGATTDTTADVYDWTGAADASTSIHYRQTTPAKWGPTWDETACLGPIPSAGRWSDVPAGLRWDDNPAPTTWDGWQG